MSVIKQHARNCDAQWSQSLPWIDLRNLLQDSLQRYLTKTKSINVSLSWQAVLKVDLLTRTWLRLYSPSFSKSITVVDRFCTAICFKQKVENRQFFTKTIYRCSTRADLKVCYPCWPLDYKIWDRQCLVTTTNTYKTNKRCSQLTCNLFQVRFVNFFGAILTQSSDQLCKSSQTWC